MVFTPDAARNQVASTPTNTASHIDAGHALRGESSRRALRVRGGLMDAPMLPFAHGTLVQPMIGAHPPPVPHRMRPPQTQAQQRSVPPLPTLPSGMRAPKRLRPSVDHLMAVWQPCSEEPACVALAVP
mmetsp:Transcript_897/g.2464  ORF Transcript_897/g.2464 Transcript_897/m.2464 type:complete len:128 (+) Transcript_897:487-870(+)